MTMAGEAAPATPETLDAIMALLVRARGLGGLCLRDAGDGGRAAIAAWERAGGGPVRRVPRGVDHERLTGGLDLAAALATGRPVRAAGLIEQAKGGLLVVHGADGLANEAVAALSAALDAREACVLALVDGDETLPPALADRLAILDPVAPGEGGGKPVADVRAAMCEISVMLGVASLRATMLAVRAAGTLAQGRAIGEHDLMDAARLVLAPRATRLPQPEETPPPDEADPLADSGEGGRVADRVIDAVTANLPPDMLAALAEGRSAMRATARGKGERRRSPLRGRPLGARAGVPRGGVRLALVDTLRAAAPWQTLRGRDDARIRIRKPDLRVRRFESRAETTTIFAVDASGSSALARLGEAKGAVELMLAEAYVKRAEVALIAFRGNGAELLLPPTRSLTRARRALGDLPGGGGTPIAAGLIAARAQAEAARAKGRTPCIVVLSDGRANVGSGGTRFGAASEAEAAAKRIAEDGHAAVFIDISVRPRAEGAALALAMRARYLALPRGDAQALHRAIGA
jgi:magnesium chelatase subunit D